MSTICQKSMILPEQKSEIYCHLDFHPKSQPRNVLKMFLGFQEIEPIVLINVFLYKKRSVAASDCLCNASTVSAI